MRKNSKDSAREGINLALTKCPKCQRDLCEAGGNPYALVKYLDQENRTKGGDSVDPKTAIPVTAYYCKSCRHVELFAGEY
jgi:hypothetical protein